MSYQADQRNFATRPAAIAGGMPGLYRGYPLDRVQVLSKSCEGGVGLWNTKTQRVTYNSGQCCPGMVVRGVKADTKRLTPGNQEDTADWQVGPHKNVTPTFERSEVTTVLTTIFARVAVG